MGMSGARSSLLHSMSPQIMFRTLNAPLLALDAELMLLPSLS